MYVERYLELKKAVEGCADISSNDYKFIDWCEKEGIVPKPERMTCAPALKRQLADAVNRYCVENDSNTPDFILAEFIVDCLDAFSRASRSRENWFGKALRIGDPSVVDVGPRTAG